METLTVHGKWTYSEGIVSELQFDLDNIWRVPTRTECRMLSADSKWSKCPLTEQSTPDQTISCMVPKFEGGLPKKGRIKQELFQKRFILTLVEFLSNFNFLTLCNC